MWLIDKKLPRYTLVGSPGKQQQQREIQLNPAIAHFKGLVQGTQVFIIVNI